MLRRKAVCFLLGCAALCAAAITSSAQDGTYSGYTPYSVYGIGDLAREGTAVNKTMGGVGISMRNRRVINYLNPAAVTARDSLSFMADFGLSGTNYLYEQGKIHSAKNTFNINNFVLSVPIYRSSAMYAGIAPFSNVGYDFSANETNPEVIAGAGNVTYAHYGTGGTYQLFGGAGVTLWNRLSLGAEATYYFGSIRKATDVSLASKSYRSITSGHSLQIKGATAKFGVQYEVPLKGNTRMTLGATYRLPVRLRGYSDSFTYASISSAVDTLKFATDTLGRTAAPRIPAELGLGISIASGEKWTVELDYTRSDWTQSKFDASPGFSSVGVSSFSATQSQSLRAGFEWTPNRYDTRYYYRRITYRGGAYYNESYFKLNGNGIRGFGLTFGVTLPILRYYNGVTLGVDLGQRGNLSGSNTRERYLGFNISFNIHDIWFVKPRYD